MSIDELIGLDGDVVQKLNPKTINGKFINYKELFEYLVYEDIIDTNVVQIKKLNEEDSTRVRYETEDLHKIFNSDMSKEYKDICKIGLYSGLRIGELYLLKNENIIEIDGELYFDIKKGFTKVKTKNAVRKIPIHNKIKTMILHYKKSAKNEYLFYKGVKTDGDTIVSELTKNINKELNKIIPDSNKTFHSFRKSFTSKLYDTSPDMESYIKVLIGHSVKQNITLSVYGDVNIKQLLKMVEKVDYDISF